jgi:hypothetical protein
MKIIKGSFLESSLVNIENYNKISISWFKPGDIVFSSDIELLEFYSAKIIQTCISISDFYYSINNHIYCLDNHYFFDSNYKWIKSCDLTMKSEILTISGDYEKIKNIDMIFRDVKVYNICTDGTGYFFVNNILVKPILGDIML